MNKTGKIIGACLLVCPLALYSDLVYPQSTPSISLTKKTDNGGTVYDLTATNHPDKWWYKVTGSGISDAGCRVNEKTFGTPDRFISWQYTPGNISEDDKNKYDGGFIGNTPIIPHSLVIQTSPVKAKFIDDGNGNIVGDGASGTINYTTRQLNLTFTKGFERPKQIILKDSGTVTGGSFTLSFGGQTSTPVNYDSRWTVDREQLRNAVRSLTNLEPAGFTTDKKPYTIDYRPKPGYEDSFFTINNDNVEGGTFSIDQFTHFFINITYKSLVNTVRLNENWGAHTYNVTTYNNDTCSTGELNTQEFTPMGHNLVVEPGSASLEVWWEWLKNHQYGIQWKKSSQTWSTSTVPPQVRFSDYRQTSYTIPGLEPGIKYDVRLFMYRANGTVIDINTDANVDPQHNIRQYLQVDDKTPLAFTIDTYGVSEEYIRLMWTEIKGKSYRLTWSPQPEPAEYGGEYIRSVPDRGDVTLAPADDQSPNPDVFMYKVKNLVPGINYDFSLKVLNHTPANKYSPTRTIKTKGEIPEYPKKVPYKSNGEATPLRIVAENEIPGRDLGSPFEFSVPAGGDYKVQLQGAGSGQFDVCKPNGLSSGTVGISNGHHFPPCNDPVEENGKLLVQIRTKPGITYDYETRPEYKSRLVVIDDDTKTTIRHVDFTIFVSDEGNHPTTGQENRPPEFPADFDSLTRSKFLDASDNIVGIRCEGLNVEFPAAVDPDGDDVGYELLIQDEDGGVIRDDAGTLPTNSEVISNSPQIRDWLKVSPTTVYGNGQPKLYGYFDDYLVGGTYVVYIYPFDKLANGLRYPSGKGSYKRIVIYAINEHGGREHPESGKPVRPCNDTGGPSFGSDIDDQSISADETFSFTIPEASDPDKDTLTYTATKADGTALPSWLTFDSGTRTFSGTSPATGETLEIKVEAREPWAYYNRPASKTFTLTVVALIDGANHISSVDAGRDFNASQGDTVNLVGKVTLFDPSADVDLRYEWSISGSSNPVFLGYDKDDSASCLSEISAPCLTNKNSLNATFRVLAIPDGQWIDFQLKVIEDNTHFSTDTVRMTIAPSTEGGGNQEEKPALEVTPIDESLQVSAGVDFEAKRGEDILLSGVVNNPENLELTYKWIIYDASHNELKTLDNLESPDSISTDFTVPVRREMEDRSALDNGQWIEFQLQVKDSDQNIRTDQVKVTIKGTTWTENRGQGEDDEETSTADLAGEDDSDEEGAGNGPQGDVESEVESEEESGDDEEAEEDIETAECFSDITVSSGNTTSLDNELWNNAGCGAHHKANHRARYFKLDLAERSRLDISVSSGADMTLFVSRGDPQNDWGTAPGATYEHRRDVRRDNGKLVYESASGKSIITSLTLDVDAYTLEVVLDEGYSPDKSFAVTLSAESAPLPKVSIADARVNENSGSDLEFSVTLDSASGEATQVNYRTSDGTARSGEDYTAVFSTLVIPAGTTSATVSVSIINDAVNEGDEQMYVTLSSPSGLRIHRSKATGTISNTDPMPAGWLIRFGRMTGDQAVEAITSRLGETGRFQDSHLTVAGNRVWSNRKAGGDARPALAPDLAGRHIDLHDSRVPSGYERTVRHGALDSILPGSAFRLSLNDGGDSGRSLTAWGKVGASSFNGSEDHLGLDGRALSYFVGADAAWRRWVAGLAVQHTTGDGKFRGGDAEGHLDAGLTTVYPYAQFRAGERLDAWAVAGIGAGSLTLRVHDKDPVKTDTAMRAAAGGVRMTLLEGWGGLALDGRMDAGVNRVALDAVEDDTGNLAASDGYTHRVRMALDGRRPFRISGARLLTPSFTLGLRHDGGDAETGAGLDIGGSLNYIDSDLGLSIDLAGRTLLAHADDNYREWGASAAIRLDPLGDNLGLAFSLAPSWGAQVHGGSERLWSMRNADGLNRLQGHGNGMRLHVDARYGMALPGLSALSPFVRLSMDGGYRDWASGFLWDIRNGAALSVEATRQRHGERVDHGLGLELRVSH